MFLPVFYLINLSVVKHKYYFVGIHFYLSKNISHSTTFYLDTIFITMVENYVNNWSFDLYK